jgi:hypothetical protein
LAGYGLPNYPTETIAAKVLDIVEAVNEELACPQTHGCGTLKTTVSV